MVKNMRTGFILAILLAILVAGACFSGCTTSTPPEVTPTPTMTTAAPTTVVPTTATGPRETLLIATTTSLYDTGLLDYLEKIYESQYNVDLQITSQGTGKAIELAKRGDADVLLVHSPSQEMTYLEDGYGLNRRSFAYNYFIIVGPSNDPAGISGLSPEEAFKKLRTEGMNSGSNVFFVSRGDNSGTHSAEKTIWKNAGFDYATQIQKSGNWYLEAGKGMGETLTLANEKQAYTLSDEGTFLAFKSNLSLTPLVSQGSSLLNVYSVMTVYPQNPDLKKIELANQFVNYLISNQTMIDIGNYGIDKYGKGLFTPMTKGVPPGVKADFTTPATATKPLKVYQAGSLNAPMAKLEMAFEQQHPDVDVQLFSGGSGTLVDKVNKNGQFADVLASADYTLIPKYLMPKNASYYLNFAKNSIVLCYNNMSQYADTINANNWYLILNREGVTYAISDPTSDPAGYRSLMTIQLAERHYGFNDIFENLIGAHSKMTTTATGPLVTIDATNPSPDGKKLTITKTGPDIVPLLAAGTVDYAFEYSSVAIQNGLPYVSLPEAIDLSAQADADTYALVQVKRPSGAATVTEVGTPIVYGVTIPTSARDTADAIAFVNLMISSDGQAILSADGQTPIAPAMGYGSVPEGIHT
jgi:tungstate transport system substrate-binding protein